MIRRLESFDRYFSIRVDYDLTCTVGEIQMVLGETCGDGLVFFDVGEGMDTQISLYHARVIG